jgi:hypothetical protein
MSLQVEHADSSGASCNHKHVPWLSIECKSFVRRGLLEGKSDAVLLESNRQRVLLALQGKHSLPSIDAAKHAIQNPASSGIPVPRDYLLTSKDIAVIRSKFDQSTWKLDKNPAESVRLLLAKEIDSVVLYQQQAFGVPFIACLMTEWQLNMLIQHGHGNTILMDATASTNNQKVRN